MVPLPSFSVPSQTADPVRVAIVLPPLINVWLNASRQISASATHAGMVRRATHSPLSHNERKLAYQRLGPRCHATREGAQSPRGFFRRAAYCGKEIGRASCRERV